MTLLLFVPMIVRAQSVHDNLGSHELQTITSLDEFDALSTVAPEEEYRLRTTLSMYCYDPEWNVIWAGRDGLAHFVKPPAAKLPFKAGQMYEIDGFAYPGKRTIDWARTHIIPKGDSPQNEVVPLDDRAREFDQFAGQLVEFEALVDAQIERGPNHLRLDLIVADRVVWAWVLFPDRTPLPDLRGTFVRIRGVLAIRRDSSGEIVRRELWVGEPTEIRPVSRLGDDAGFGRPATTIDAIGARPNDTLRLKGVVRAHEQGQWLILRDSTGQLKLSTLQSQQLRAGDAIEALVFPTSRNGDTGLRRAIFRRLAQEQGPHGEISSAGLHLVEQIRDLPVNSQMYHRTVELKGVVTWSDVNSRFIFFEDGSGGIKVYLPEDKQAVPNQSTGVSIVGTLQTEGGVPVVICSSLLLGKRDIGVSHPPEITIEEALAGTMHGRLIRIRGLVRSVVQQTHFAEINLSTAGGELTAMVPGISFAQSIEGSIVELRGVCDAVFDGTNRPTSIRIWMTSDEDIRVLETSDTNPFATPRRSVSSVLQFSVKNNVNQRVQLTGVVLLHRPGEFLYLEEGNDGLLVHTRSGAALQPGDRVDVVGFPGHEGWQPVLREAVFRKIGSGPQPVAQTLLTVDVPERELDGKLVRLTATLLDVVRKGSRARLQLQANQTIFESSWDAAGESHRWNRAACSL